MSNATLRRGTLDSLAHQLDRLHEAKYDIVVPGNKVTSVGGQLVVEGGDRGISADGVTYLPLVLEQTPAFRRSMAGRLGIPIKYAEFLWADDAVDPEPGAPAPLRDLYDINISRLMANRPGRKHLIRGYRFRGPDGSRNDVARCLLGPTYRIMDNVLVLYAALDAMNATNYEFEIVSADLTDRRMYVKVACPGIYALAPTLLDGYTSPYGGARGTDNPVVFAGFILSNSETGQGRLKITPTLTVQVCSNGLTMNHDVLAKTHLGGELADGQVNWSDATQAANRELVRSQVGDVVRSALSIDYVERQVARLTEKAGTPIPDGSEEAVITDVGGTLKWTEDERAGILRAFLRGGQDTAGGLMQAVTAFSQRVDDADRAYELESHGTQVLEMVR